MLDHANDGEPVRGDLFQFQADNGQYQIDGAEDCQLVVSQTVEDLPHHHAQVLGGSQVAQSIKQFGVITHKQTMDLKCIKKLTLANK